MLTKSICACTGGKNSLITQNLYGWPHGCLIFYVTWMGDFFLVYNSSIRLHQNWCFVLICSVTVMKQLLFSFLFSGQNIFTGFEWERNVVYIYTKWYFKSIIQFYVSCFLKWGIVRASCEVFTWTNKLSFTLLVSVTAICIKNSDMVLSLVSYLMGTPCLC